jgi:hypothetical protein
VGNTNVANTAAQTPEDLIATYGGEMTWFVSNEVVGPPDDQGAQQSVLVEPAPLEATVVHSQGADWAGPESIESPTYLSRWLISEVFNDRSAAASAAEELASKITTRRADWLGTYKFIFLWALDTIFGSSPARKTEAAQLAVDLTNQFDRAGFNRFIRIEAWTFGQLFRSDRRQRPESFDFALRLSSADEGTVELFRQLFMTATEEGMSVTEGMSWACTQTGV